MRTASPLWTPSPERIAAAPITAFAAAASVASGRCLAEYEALHRWSVDEPDAFWRLVWHHCRIIGDPGGPVLAGREKMPGAAFFPDARLNFAENLLWKTGGEDALVFYGEDKVERRLSWDQLRALVSRLQQLFTDMGVAPGSRVAAMMPNMPESVAGMLAATSLGAVWSSCSPDFGVDGVVGRFSQIEPTLLIAVDGYWFNGTPVPVSEKVRGIVERLPSLRHILVADYIGGSEQAARSMPRAASWHRAVEPYRPRALVYEPFPFSHPAFILFSSGTTGAPKCIVHSAGGTLLQHVKEHRLHCGIAEGGRVFYSTSCGWMMWNWLVSALASGATLLLYDGSPLYPDGNLLFDYVDIERVSFFGTSAKFIDTLRKSGLAPMRTHDLSSLEVLASTGSPLSPDCFAYVYGSIKRDVHLASISGGTDIISCFAMGIPSKPVWAGEIQGPALGMAVEILAEDGTPLDTGKGELACTRPFPSMPVGFWNDPDGIRYRAAYFERFGNTWHHGDFAQWTGHGGIIIHGRSDATLKPGGVRIGTAEIYDQVERLPEIAEAVCIGQEWNDDIRIVLFVKLAEGCRLDLDLKRRIRSAVGAGASPSHVPDSIIAVADIPRTRSGKISELAVREAVHGRPVRNREALANPEALDLFSGLTELE